MLWDALGPRAWVAVNLYLSSSHNLYLQAQTTRMTADELVQTYRDALLAQAKANAAEAQADDARKVVLSEQVLAAGDVPLSKAEHIARASAPYKLALTDLNHARDVAETARAEVEATRVRFEKWRTAQSLAKVMRQTNG